MTGPWVLIPRPGLTSAAYRAVQVLPNDSRSRAVLPRLRQRARTWSMLRRVARLAERAPESRDAVAAGGSWKRGGLGRAHLGGEGRLNCRLGRALMSCWAGFDPHPAPTPLNNTVSISETRLPYFIENCLNFILKLSKFCLNYCLNFF